MIAKLTMRVLFGLAVLWSSSLAALAQHKAVDQIEPAGERQAEGSDTLGKLRSKPATGMAEVKGGGGRGVPKETPIPKHTQKYKAPPGIVTHDVLSHNSRTSNVAGEPRTWPKPPK